MASAEEEQVKAQFQRLKQMLLHQGVVVGEEEEEGETKQGDWEEEPTTLRHEKKKMEQRQYALEKLLANLHLENQSLKKEMRGAFPTFCCKDCDIGCSFLFWGCSIPCNNMSLTFSYDCCCSLSLFFLFLFFLFLLSIQQQLKLIGFLIYYFFPEIKQMEQTQALKAKEVETKRLEIEQSKQVTVEDLTYAVLKYKKLGLDFLKGERGAIQCNFTQIDLNFPSKIFSFQLKVAAGGGEQYEVEGCCPDLKAGVIYSLVEELNESVNNSEFGDFAGLPIFIQSMRQAFKDSLEDS